MKEVGEISLSIRDMKESTSIESGKLPLKKEVGQQYPWGMSLSVFLPTLTNKINQTLAIAQGLSTVFPLSKILGMQSALTLQC